jgi:thymidylate kinase
MKKISLKVMGEKFEIELEDEFFEYVKEDLIKLQNQTPKDILFLILEKNKKEYELLKKIEKILKNY